ncbi:unnamed protein product [Trichogramma brassicae]|uniref:Arrestin C-terminal-like domain-containing protein n=1 Tax=Trichogramma brassicae TaxID=86971 RepID=A0A6H5J5B6_9HYME|nr:unnamed protein product [Trichogramma brassicae]
MPKLTDFRVQFDREGSTFQPGETVSGRVIVTLTKPKNIKEIRLEARGEAEVHWTKSRNVKDSSGRSHHHTDHYRGTEHYFNVSNRLLGTPAGSNHATISAGEHIFPFTFQLPNNIPCSIEHVYGHVRYTVKAVLDRPWRFDHKVVQAFTVIAPFDLNAQPHLTTGIDDEIRRKFLTCCCFGSGGMTINVKSRVSGFVPGETIDLKVSYDNTSNRVDLKKISVKLQKSVEFFASTPFADKKICTTTIKKIKDSGAFEKKGERTIKIEVPPLPPSRLEHCHIIHVAYNLVFETKVTGMHFGASKCYPIEIGTIPLYQQSSDSLNATLNTTNISSITPVLPSAPPIDQISASSPPMPQTSTPIGFVIMSVPPYMAGAAQAMPEMPPPSYEECISGGNLISNPKEQGMHGQSVPFAPKYPVYKFPMPSSSE